MWILFPFSRWFTTYLFLLAVLTGHHLLIVAKPLFLIMGRKKCECVWRKWLMASLEWGWWWGGGDEPESEKQMQFSSASSPSSSPSPLYSFLSSSSTSSSSSHPTCPCTPCPAPKQALHKASSHSHGESQSWDSSPLQDTVMILPRTDNGQCAFSWLLGPERQWISSGLGLLLRRNK